MYNNMMVSLLDVFIYLGIAPAWELAKKMELLDEGGFVKFVLMHNKGIKNLEFLALELHAGGVWAFLSVVDYRIMRIAAELAENGKLIDGIHILMKTGNAPGLAIARSAINVYNEKKGDAIWAGKINLERSKLDNGYLI